MELSSAEIGTMQDAKELELRESSAALAEVEQNILLLSRQIIDLQGKKKDLEYTKSKARQNLHVIQSEMRELKSKFWSAKSSGL
jgi:peptidoglycan hydrolase CwlO-like protein